MLCCALLQPYIQARRGLQVAMLILLLASFSRAYVSDGDQLLITALFCGLSVAYIQAVSLASSKRGLTENSHYDGALLSHANGRRCIRCSVIPCSYGI